MSFPKILTAIVLFPLTISIPAQNIVQEENSDVLCITSWNNKIMQLAIEEDKLLTLKGVRTEALMHIAIHDALNAIDAQFENFSFLGKYPHANPIAAINQAAYTIASSQFPDKQSELNEELNRWLEPIEEGSSKSSAIKLGKEAALAILDLRKDDQFDGEADYTWHPMAPGVYAEFNEHSGTPEGFIFGAGWAAAKPFLLARPDHFRSPPPPAIKSDAYTDAFDEVKQYGGSTSTKRTADQTHLAMWWKDFVENSHNRLARDLVVKEQLDLWETARLFALLNMTIFDAYINVFDNKFHYNHWRPYTAIRWADHDENPNTLLDTTWNNLHKHTYAFPSYPSAHGTASTAAMKVLAHTLGKGDIYSFDMRTEQVDEAGPFSEKMKMTPAIRSFQSFSEAGLEASMSRIYLGIHFRYDSKEGYHLGSKIGEYAQQFLEPMKNEMKVRFVTSGLDDGQFQHLFKLDEDALRELGAVREEVISKPGYPCVISLEDADIGEEILLLTYEHIASNSPYQSGGPIFIRERVNKTVLQNQIPQNLIDRMLSIRVYDENDMMVGARTMEGSQLMDYIQEAFQKSSAHYIDVHISGPGCFNCRINRLK